MVLRGMLKVIKLNNDNDNNNNKGSTNNSNNQDFFKKIMSPKLSTNRQEMLNYY